MRVDRENNRLFILHDATREAVWYQLFLNIAGGALFSRPQEIGRIAFENMPVRMAIDRLRSTLRSKPTSLGRRRQACTRDGSRCH